jgi:ELWxxDGT repeat protein
MLRDINTLPPNSSPTEFVQSGDNIFAVANDGVPGRELFVSDGASPLTLVLNIRSGGFSSDPTDLVDVGGLLFFTANDGQNGRELWVSDGTIGGTRMVLDIFPGTTDTGFPRSSSPHELTVAAIPDAPLLFFTADSEEGRELWMADANGASLVHDIFTGEDESANPRSALPSDLTFWALHLDDEGNEIPPAVYFSAESMAGRELWKTEIIGGATTTSLLKNIFEDELGADPDSSDPRNLIVYQNNLIFSANGGEFDENDELIAEGSELWRSDGTQVGTKLVKE